MKKRIAVFAIMAGLTIYGCSNQTSVSLTTTPVEIKEEMPVKIHYSRQWEYSLEAETEDLEAIKDIVEAIRLVEIGSETQMVTMDYTDIIRLIYADGSEEVFEFEENNIVIDEKRYEATGIRIVREQLEKIVDEEI